MRHDRTRPAVTAAVNGRRTGRRPRAVPAWGRGPRRRRGSATGHQQADEIRPAPGPGPPPERRRRRLAHGHRETPRATAPWPTEPVVSRSEGAAQSPRPGRRCLRRSRPTARSGRHAPGLTAVAVTVVQERMRAAPTMLGPGNGPPRRRRRGQDRTGTVTQRAEALPLAPATRPQGSTRERSRRGRHAQRPGAPVATMLAPPDATTPIRVTRCDQRRSDARRRWRPRPFRRGRGTDGAARPSDAPHRTSDRRCPRQWRGRWAPRGRAPSVARVSRPARTGRHPRVDSSCARRWRCDGGRVDSGLVTSGWLRVGVLVGRRHSRPRSPPAAGRAGWRRRRPPRQRRNVPVCSRDRGLGRGPGQWGGSKDPGRVQQEAHAVGLSDAGR